MGFSYSMDGKLCCDYCGSTGARKYKCPHGWCPSWAACPECRKAHAKDFAKEGHAKCKIRHEEYMAEEQERKAIIDGGGAVRTCALSHGEKTKVIFQRSADRIAYYMDRKTYNAIPVMQIATPDDYRQFGPITQAADTDIYNPE